VDVLSGKASVGQRVVVIGGDMVGCETADFLADQGKKVTVTRRGPRMAVKVMPGLRPALMDRLRTKGVTLLTGVKYEEVSPAGLVITDKEGKKRTIEVDTVVLAAGAQPRTELQAALQGRLPELHLVGDCVEPRGILEAIHEGSRVGRAL
jgi:pyruvate/2-oxoglutarate dehydrogenase complex dihydrolipoamide dehydrogenase (E3) component